MRNLLLHNYEEKKPNILNSFLKLKNYDYDYYWPCKSTHNWKLELLKYVQNEKNTNFIFAERFFPELLLYSVTCYNFYGIILQKWLFRLNIYIDSCVLG